MKKDSLTTRQFIGRVAIVVIFLGALAFFIMCIFNMDWSAKVLNSIWETIKPIVYGAALAYLTNFILVKVLSIEHKILSKSKKMSSFCDKHSTLIRNVAIFISELVVLVVSFP